MIGKLRGLVDSVGDDWVILDVGGVGYHVTCPGKTLANLPQLGAEATLSIETYVREDQIRLFGFSDAQQRECFRILQTVQGVGAKVAISILGVLSPAELSNAVAFQDKAAITRAPGVGPKVGERIVIELKNKLAAFVSASPAAIVAAGAPAGATAAGDAISAIVNLGYSREQAAGAVAQAARSAGEDAPAEKLIRLGLRQLAA